ncbi:MAG: hypothetical protein M0P13_03805, partial [Fibrobacteraceae bacterium]|nr:hypothetical protein [Fibrobacteraceae bacterium]
MKKLFLPLSLLLLTTAFIGCGNDSSSSSDETSSSSEESSSSISSSSYSNRLDVDYADTLTLDTIKFENGKDSPSQATSLKLFLGNFPKGTLITISGKKKSGGHADSLYVREEEGSYLKPTTAVIESGNTLYRDYGRLGDSANFATNKFITQLTSGFYYVEIPKISTADNGSYSILITSNIDTA